MFIEQLIFGNVENGVSWDNIVHPVIFAVKLINAVTFEDTVTLAKEVLR